MPSRTDTAWASCTPRSVRPIMIKSALPAVGLTFQPHRPIPTINRIPVELLAKIFAHYVAAFDSENMVWHTVSSLERTPTILGHVCQRWRGVALTFPMLWSSIAIHSPSRGDIPLVKMWLDRSGSCPLSVRLRPSQQPILGELERVNSILEILCTQSHRWRDIDILLAHDTPRALTNISHESLRRLESAKIDVSWWRPDIADQLLATFLSSPTIRRVDWGPYYGRNPPNVPWFQLTHVKLRSDSTPQEFLDILRHCTLLEGVHISLDSGERLLDTHICVKLPNLRSLSILGYVEPGPLLDHLLLPALVKLKLTYRLDASTRISRVATIQNLLHRSSCLLEKFIFADDSISESELCQLLTIPELSTITNLKLSSAMTDETLNLLTRTCPTSGDIPSGLYPRLEALYLRLCYPTDGIFSTMIESRRTGPGSRLKFVQAYLRSKDSLEHDRMLMENMCQFGLLVCVSTRRWRIPKRFEAISP
ncbi:hypothetical protein BD779DRAFT_1111791 [Infundibulicybe gibba]|nr:hypothetical protein BD779DRAFT_1111791 [Infundibulicybe gibba]